MINGENDIMETRTRKWYERTAHPKVVVGESMTQQHMKDECDINNIMAKYQKTGLITHVAKYEGNYDDFTVMPDFKTAMDTMMAAQDMFLTLPSDVREKFDNDPGTFVEFATDSCNYEEMVELGLVPIEVQQANEARNAFKKAKKKSAKAEIPADKISEKPQPSGEDSTVSS